jgi:pSer/pThr/pTyr-binding forkhead associated (FHA) protein
MPEIIVKYADKVIERVVTEKERISIGRTSENDIILDNRGVSRKHAQIEFSDKGALIIDNDSLNGTFVNHRKVNESFLQDSDTITIGKFDLVFFQESQPVKKISDMDGTMVLNTRKQKELVHQDSEDKEVAAAAGGTVLLALDGSEKKKVRVANDITTLGKSSFANVQVRGFWVSKLQAKIIREGESYTILNIGHSGKTKVNGEIARSATLKNGDIIEVGKSVFRFIEG